MNHTGFRELDKEVVELHPQRVDLIPDYSSGVDRVVESSEDGVEVDVNRDLPEVAVFGCKGSECHNSPRDGTILRPEHNIRQFRRLGEVDRNRVRTLWFGHVFKSGANPMAKARKKHNLPFTWGPRSTCSRVSEHASIKAVTN